MAVQARDRIVMSAIKLGQRDGWSKLSVADVLDDSGVARGSFYKHFPGGVPEVTLDAVRTAGDWISAIVDEACRRPAPEALDAFVEHWSAMLVAADFTLGCPVAAASAARPQHPEAADLAARTFDAWEASIAAALRRDGLDAAEAQRLGVVMVAAVEGAVVRCVARRSTEPLAVIHEHLRQALERSMGERQDGRPAG